MDFRPRESSVFAMHHNYRGFIRQRLAGAPAGVEQGGVSSPGGVKVSVPVDCSAFVLLSKMRV